MDELLNCNIRERERESKTIYASEEIEKNGLLILCLLSSCLHYRSSHKVITRQKMSIDLSQPKNA